MREGINCSKMVGRSSRLPSAGSRWSVVRSHLLATAVVLAFSACSTSPRVVEVSSHKRLETVEVADQDIYLHDRASQIHLQSELLPADERRQEFFVRWSGTGIDLVKFEYRQVNVPDKISEESYVPENRRWNVFEVRGNDFTKGGAVSAWRVSLWRDSQLLADKKSLLW
jgi:hypothetical protein